MSTPLKASRFALDCKYHGSYFAGPVGELIATDGHVLVAYGIHTLSAAHAALRDGIEPKNQPPKTAREIATALEGVLVDRAGVSEEVTLDTKPCERMVREWRATLVAQESDGASKLRLLVHEREEARKQPKEVRDRLDRDIIDSKARLSGLRKRLKNRDDPSFHGIEVGGTAIDLRLIKRALRFLGVKHGELRVWAGPHDPVALYTAKGCALIMPFRA